MEDNNCVYCMQGELAAKFGYLVCAMDTGYLYIFKRQSKSGRAILAYKDHVSEMISINGEERDVFFADVARVARAIRKIYKPDKTNYGAYGDTNCRLHMHIAPKYNGGNEWGGTFQIDPDRVYLADDEYGAMAEQIRAVL